MREAFRRRCPLCNEPYTKYDGAGPLERRWVSRLRFLLRRSWSRPVVNERLVYDHLSRADLNVHLAEKHGVPLEAA